MFCAFASLSALTLATLYARAVMGLDSSTATGDIHIAGNWIDTASGASYAICNNEISEVSVS